MLSVAAGNEVSGLIWPLQEAGTMRWYSVYGVDGIRRVLETSQEGLAMALAAGLTIYLF